MLRESRDILTIEIMYKSIIIAMALLICFSCGAPKVAMTTDVQKDSVSVVIKESVISRDTTIYVEVPVEVVKEILPASDTSHLETSLAVSDAWVNAGKLNHTLIHKDVKIEQNLPIPEKHSQKDSVVVSIQEIVKEVPVEVEKKLTYWQRMRMTLGDLAMIAIAVWSVFIIIKRVWLR
jgi:ADP-glucose pyrophosphorylase